VYGGPLRFRVGQAREEFGSAVIGEPAQARGHGSPEYVVGEGKYPRMGAEILR